MSMRKKVQLSYFIREEADQKHHCGINALQYDVETSRLFTAGRDSVIRMWNTKKEKDHLLQNMEHHADWVNDIILCCDGRYLISSSNDTTVKVWNATKGFCMSTLRTHQDYVRCLAYAKDHEQVASAGLDNAIFLWDVRTLTALTPTNNTVTTSSFRDNQHSIYSLALNPSGTVMVSGSPDKLIRGWDPRTCHKIFQLRGHAGNIRSLIVRPDGQEILSASSDGTIRLWSVGMQCCIDTIRVHTEGVFTIQVDKAWSTVYSAGKDRQIYATELRATAHSTLICEESDPILRLLLVENTRTPHLWSSTCNSNVNRWPLPARTTVEIPHSGDSQSMNRLSHPLSVITTSPTRQHPSNERLPLNDEKSDSTHSTDLCKPSMTILGGPSIIQYHICSEKRYIVTKDSDANVAVYDALKACLVESFGLVDFEEEIKKREKLIYVPNWFTVDLKCGMPIIHLDESDGLSANITLSDADLMNEFREDEHLGQFNPDTKVNFGVLLLRSLFARWPKANIGDAESVRQDPFNHSIVGVPDHTPIILSDASGRALVRFLVRDATPLNEQPMLCDSVPDWIQDVVADRKWPKSTRIEFFLLPAVREYNEKGQCRIVPLGSLKRDCLSASDILPIRKVMEHVYQRLLKLAESFTVNMTSSNPSSPRPTSPNVNPSVYSTTDRFGQVNSGTFLDGKSSRPAQSPYFSPTSSRTTPTPMAPLDLPPETFQSDLSAILEAETSGEPNPENIIEIWCADQHLDPNSNLRSVRYFYWKQPGYLVLSYILQHRMPGTT